MHSLERIPPTKLTNLIRDPSKKSKITYLAIFNKLKHFTVPTFWVLLKTLNMPLLG